MARKTIHNTSELKLGDQVELFDGPFGWGTVYWMNETELYVSRPYLSNAFCKVSRYVGIECIAPESGCERVKFLRNEVRTYTIERCKYDATLRGEREEGDKVCIDCVAHMYKAADFVNGTCPHWTNNNKQED